MTGRCEKIDLAEISRFLIWCEMYTATPVIAYRASWRDCFRGRIYSTFVFNFFTSSRQDDHHRVMTTRESSWMSPSHNPDKTLGCPNCRKHACLSLRVRYTPVPLTFWVHCRENSWGVVSSRRISVGNRERESDRGIAHDGPLAMHIHRGTSLIIASLPEGVVAAVDDLIYVLENGSASPASTGVRGHFGDR